MSVPALLPCPKQMRFGPCGGVDQRGGCEVDGDPCPFVGSPRSPAEEPILGQAAPRLPNVIVDVRLSQSDVDEWPEVWQRYGVALNGAAALLGEHVDNPACLDDSGGDDPDEPIFALSRLDVPTLVTVTGRDRDLAAVAQRAESAAAAGAAAILCVTGDHPAVVQSRRPVMFGAESMTMCRRLASTGLALGVGESPASPGNRVQRLLDKQHAGASMCVLNHAGDAGILIDFVERARMAGVTLDFYAPIALVADAETARSLSKMPGLQLVRGLLGAVASASNPRAEGRRWAASEAQKLSSSGLFAGCNLSGGSRRSPPSERMEITREFLQVVGSAWQSAR